MNLEDFTAHLNATTFWKEFTFSQTKFTPRLNGLDLTKFAAACRKELPVIVTSGGHRLRTEDLPGNAQFIAKPYELCKVLEMLVEAIGLGPCRHMKTDLYQAAA